MSRFLTRFRLLFTGLFLAGQGMVFAREPVTLQGSVRDSATGTPLPFVQIGILRSTLGTVTNADGFFRITIPGEHVSDTLLVACIGYAPARIRITGEPATDLEIRLKPRALLLSEFEVVALSPEEVIRRVVASIPANYGADPLILTAFIRSRKFLNNRLAEYTEAIIGDRKSGYTLYAKKKLQEKHDLSNIPELVKGRVISDTNLVNAIGDLGKSAGCLGCNFINDFVEFYHHTVLDEDLFGKYTFRMKEESRPEGGKIYHIWFDQKKGVKETLWKGEMLINGADFALLSISQKPSFEAFDTYEKKKFRRSFEINHTAGWIQEMPLLDWTTTYVARDGKYYLNTISVDNVITYTNPASGQKLRFSYKNEVVVTDASRDPEKLKAFKGDKSVGVNQRWDQLVGKTDAAFWENYNFLPMEEKLREAVEKLQQKTGRREENSIK